MGRLFPFVPQLRTFTPRNLSQSPRNGISAAPFVVNSAFALELYLKALSMVHGREQRGHDLVKLFDNLPGSALAAILAQLATASVNSVWNCGVSTQQQVRSVLDELRSVFVDWRYLYEKDRAKSVAFRSLIFVTELLHKTCQGNPKINPPA